MNAKLPRTAGIAVLAAGLCAASASAGTTTVNTGSETTLTQIITNIIQTDYGAGFGIAGSLSGGFLASDGFNSFNITRIDDFTGGGLSGPRGTNTNLVAGAGAGGTDQIWDDGIAAAHARARFAGFSQTFGYATADSSTGLLTGGFNTIFNVTGSGFAVSGNALFNSTPTGLNLAEWAWAREGNAGNFQYSLDAANTDGSDHMVTFRYVDHLGRINWILAFEDVTGSGSDRDFNDLVVTLHVIPLPSGGALALAGLGLVAARRNRR